MCDTSIQGNNLSEHIYDLKIEIRTFLAAYRVPTHTGADTGFSSGGDRILHSPKILHDLYNEFTRKYQEKNLCPPPESLRGGHFGFPPPELLRRGTILRGGDSPLFPPCIRSCL